MSASTLRPELQTLLRRLLDESEDKRELSLDDVGRAIGDRAVTHDEIDALLAELEGAGRTVSGPRPGAAGEHLRKVLPAARALGSKLGRRPTVDELAHETGISADEVRAALGLGRVMGR